MAQWALVRDMLGREDCAAALAPFQLACCLCGLLHAGPAALDSAEELHSALSAALQGMLEVGSSAGPAGAHCELPVQQLAARCCAGSSHVAAAHPAVRRVGSGKLLLTRWANCCARLCAGRVLTQLPACPASCAEALD